LARAKPVSGTCPAPVAKAQPATPDTRDLVGPHTVVFDPPFALDYSRPVRIRASLAKPIMAYSSALLVFAGTTPIQKSPEMPVAV